MPKIPKNFRKRRVLLLTEARNGRIAQSEQDIRFLHRILDFHAERGDQKHCESVLKLLRRAEGKSFRPADLREEATLAIKLAGGDKKVAEELAAKVEHSENPKP
jgi:hypothetical protein